MRVNVYPEGDSDRAEQYDVPPEIAAQLFSKECEEEGNLCVEALDDEARALSGWHSDEDSTHYRMFKSRAETTYYVTEVQTFRT
jgi:hypothetical protein